MKKRILLAEDEQSLREGIALNLELEGYEVKAVENGMEAMEAFPLQRFNLVILDVMMPKINGFDVCEKIRLTDTDTPILFLTAKDTSKDKIQGLKVGADDYLTKPFNLEELLLRVKVLVKRSLKNEAIAEAVETIQFGKNIVDFKTFTADTAKGKIKLTQRELQLLKLLVDRKNTVVSRNQIFHYVWGYDVYPSTRTIDNFILAFRKYFEENPKKPQYFQSVRGVGYKFVLEG